MRQLALCFLILATAAGCTLLPAASDSSAPSADNVIRQAPSGGESALVTRVIDGDTIDVEINGQEFRVRYVGVNTPERDEPCFEEASSANRALVAGQTVTLTRDQSETDRFGRLLRFVYAGDVFVNATLIAQGFAEAVEYRPDTSQTANFQRLEQMATAASLGCHPSGIFNDGSTTR